MKSLHQLLRRRSRSSRRQKQAETKRRLSTQTLEQRQMLAGDVSLAHNYWNRYDVNQDFKLSPSDALGIINYLSQSHALGEQVGDGDSDSDPFAGRKVDVNADGNVTPSDALSVINAIGRGEQMDPLAEYLLAARDSDDNLLPVSNGIVQAPGVGIENSFFIEVSYSDLRNDPLGAFSFFPDIGTSRGGLITPVMHEVHQLQIGTEIADSTSGGITIQLEGSSATANVSLSELLPSSTRRDALSDALVSLGLSENEFEITEPLALKPEPSGLGFRIEYLGDANANVDMPDLIVTETFDNDPSITFTEISPRKDDGSINFDPVVLGTTSEGEDILGPSPVLTALDLRSRTFSPFVFNGTVFLDGEFYQSLNRANFDPNTGFTDTGGVGPTTPGGIPAADARDIFEQPFDAFSIEVFFNQPVSDANPLVLDVNPGEGVDPLTLYGSNDVVPEDLITIGDGARVTISTGALAVNNPPTVSGPITITPNPTEDDASFTQDLLEGANDLDGDTLTVENFNVTGDTSSAVSQNGNEITINPSVYNALKVGESQTINATYTISDGNGGSVAQSLSLVIDGVNDAPDAGADIATENDEDEAQFNIDLLQNATDPDGDSLTVTAIRQVGSDDDSGITPEVANDRIVVNPSAYSALEDGESITLTYDFDISDLNGGTDTGRVTITINGATPNRPPTVSGPIVLPLTEDDADTTQDLLANASDLDVDDILFVDEVNVTGDDTGIMRNGNVLQITPDSYNSLPQGGSATITYTYKVKDGRGGEADASATVTISGVNDAPTVAGAVTESVTEDDGSTDVDLLEGAADPDTGDSVSVDDLTLRSGDARGITEGASTLTIDPSAYNDLAVGETVTVIYDYDVIDGNGGSTPQSATITITGVNDAPTAGPVVQETVTEDDAVQSIGLLDGATDVDASDTLAVANFNVTVGDGTPFSVVNDDTLTFDPNFFNSLAQGESATVIATYDVVDGNGGVAPTSATITITGVNDAPSVSGPLSFDFTEDDVTETVSLLDNASDPDTNDTLSVASVNVTGNQAGISIDGADVTVDPSAYGDLEAGESIQINFTYNVTDGIETVEEVTATITISGAADTPVVEGPLSFTFNEFDDSTTVSLLEGASDPNNDPLFITNANIRSGDSSGVTVDVANSQLLIDPSAYRALEDGESAVVIVDYQVSDPEGNTVDQTATVTIEGQTIVLSKIEGQLFVDHIENLEEVIGGAAAIRNGVHDADEEGLGGVTIRLLEVTAEGEVVVDTTVTDNDGHYSFDGLLPGTYVVEYDIPESVQFTGSTRGMIMIGEEGGVDASGPSLNAIGLTGIVQRLDLLAKTYIAAGIIDTSGLPEGLAGGSVVFNADGTQQMFVAGEGFDAEYAEVVLNEARDAALLTIVNSQGEVMSTRLTLDQFVVAGDGEGVRFFGEIEDFDFTQSAEELVTEEFDDYRNAIDRALAAM